MKKVLLISIFIVLVLIIFGLNFYNSYDGKDAVYNEEIASELAKVILDGHSSGAREALTPISGDDELKLKVESFASIYWKISLDYEYYAEKWEEQHPDSILVMDFGYTILMKKRDGQIKLIRHEQ